MIFIISCALNSNDENFLKKNVYSQVRNKITNDDVIVLNKIKKQTNWWDVFGNTKLTELEKKLNLNNQSLESELMNYKQSLNLVRNARNNYFNNIKNIYNYYEQNSLRDMKKTEEFLNLSSNEFIKNNNVDFLKLYMQISLAQYYFELMMIDKNGELLKKIIKLYEKIHRNQVKTKIIDNNELSKAIENIRIAKSNLIENEINRVQYENAIAIIIGEASSCFNFENISNDNYPDLIFNDSNLLSNLKKKLDIKISTDQVIFNEAKNNLYSLNSLIKEEHQQKLNVDKLKKNLDITYDKYRKKTIDSNALAIKEITYYNSQRNLNSLTGLKIITTIALVKLLFY